MRVTIGKSFNSRYDIGDIVFFHPAVSRMTLEEARETALLAQVASVSFREGKVTYEIAVNVGGKGEIEFYHEIPVANVDSVFLSSEDDLQFLLERGTDIGSSGEMVSLSYSIQEKLQRLAERRCPDDPEGELQRFEEYAQQTVSAYRGLDLAELRAAAQRFHCIKTDTVMP